MTWRVLSGVVGLMTLCACVSHAQDRAVFHAKTVTIPVYATVTESDGRLVPDLMEADFQLQVDGQVRRLTVFSRETVRISAALLVDMSHSIRKPTPLNSTADHRYYINRFRLMAEQVAIDMLPADHACIGVFGSGAGLSNIIGGDKRPLITALDRMLWVNGSTPLWGVIDRAMDALRSEAPRRVILPFTDGVDTDSSRVGSGEPPLQSVLARAVRDDFMIYGIGLQGLGLDHDVQMMAEETGGGYLVLGDTGDVTDPMRRVVDELHHQYQMGFESDRDGRTHHITLEVLKPGMKARAKRSFVAPKPK